jgi:peptidoglycan hydrolase-like protein with peptidoglycan-binding domain
MSIFEEGSDEGIFGLGSLGTNGGIEKTPAPGKTTGAPAATAGAGVGVGPATTGAAPRPYEGVTPTAQGLYGSTVRAAQGVLQARGFNLGSTGVDGAFGPCTAAALRAHEARFGRQQSEVEFGTTLMERARRTTGACGARQPAAPAPGAPAEPVAPPEPTQAGVLPFQIPGISAITGPGAPIYTQWWFWLALASVAGLGYFGYKYYKEKKAEEEMDIAAGVL